MENRWTLHVRGFGKIQSADIQIAPMTFFVGDNNSGKSYLMALVYSLVNTRFRMKEFDLCQKTAAYIWCAQWLEQQFQCESHLVLVADEVRVRFETLLNLVLKRNAAKIVFGALNTAAEIGEFSVTLDRVDTQKIKFLVEEMPEEETHQYRMRPQCGESPTVGAVSRNLDPRFFVGFLLEFFLKAELTPFFRLPATFLPTSRTGFLLTYRTLLREMISDSYDSGEHEDEQRSPSALTRPCSDFLKKLSTITPTRHNGKFAAVTDFVEKQLLEGSVEVSQAPVPEISYRPQGAECLLPMHLSSGVITELTPLILMLRHGESTDTLFIEEPEMGLHPGLQSEMARVLIRIHATDVPLFVTTHSDTILQHVNNMLKLSKLPQERRHKMMERFGYDEEDLVSDNDVAMYQFDVNHETGKSTVTPLEQNEYGFVVPTFNNALEDLLNQSRSFEPEVGHEDD